MSSIRILVADDYTDWRKEICSLLRRRTEWEVVCEVADGLEAIQKAKEFKPDLILLDIGLPNLNGIEAARRIRQLSPNSRIVFVTIVNSAEIVQACLSTGAQGFVYKTRARNQLLPAIDAVLSGEQFVSSDEPNPSEI